MMILLFLLYLISTMFLITVKSAFDYSDVIFVIRGVQIVGFVVVLFGLSFAHFNRNIKYLI